MIMLKPVCVAYHIQIKQLKDDMDYYLEYCQVRLVTFYL